MGSRSDERGNEVEILGVGPGTTYFNGAAFG